MIRARGERRWYLVYQAEKEQFSMSWPVTGGNSMFVIVWKGFFLNKGGIFAGTKVGDHSAGDRRPTPITEVRSANLNPKFKAREDN